MLKGPLLMASFGLGLNLIVWGVPGMVAASGAAHLLSPSLPTLADTLNGVEQNAGTSPSLPDALVQLVGAEAEALHVAGVGLQQPAPADLAAQANHAGNRVEAALHVYLAAAQAVVNSAPHL